jgi:hypothetical protein
MITLTRRFLTILLLLTTATGIYAQHTPTVSSIGLLSAGEKQAYAKLRVPHTPLIQNNYDLKYHRFFLFTDPAVKFISGSVTSYFVARPSPIGSIQFEFATDMSADSAFHKNQKCTLVHAGRLLTITLNSIVPAAAMDSVTVYYHGNPTTSGFGSYGTTFHNGVGAMWTLSEPYGAADWWPSKNDLTDKIDSIDMYVVTPKGYHTGSNGILVSELPYETYFTLAHWKHRFPIASYLIAIASTNYARFSDYYVRGNDSLQVLNYVYPEDSLSLRVNAATVLPSMALFEDLFEPYPFWEEKYGQCQFAWGGGMEHQTMTFLGKGAFNSEIITHELAHQWFGDMITCGTWQDIWLNEGFASYCTGISYEHLFNGFYWEIWKHNVISFVCTEPGGTVFCPDTTNEDRLFDARLSYGKGAMMLHMMRWIVGDNAFYAGIRSYLQDPALRHGFARTADFKTHMETASGRDLTGFFADWFTGQGYPSYTIHVAKQLPDHSTTLFIYQTQSHPSVSFFEMPVQIRFFGGTRDTSIVFNNTFSGQSFSVNPGFVIDSAQLDPHQWIVSANNLILSVDNDLPAGKQLALMPNPARDFLNIQHNLGKINTPVILAMDGKQAIVPVKLQDESRIELDTRNLKPGTYLFRINYEGRSITRKFIVSR